ncbi:MAG: allantoinase AllB [Chloroflexi bacterium]|nr:allantoinase AllB [Chloroflexota bacterium]
MSVDLVVKNGTVVAPDFSYEANLVIHGGKFVAITRDKDLPSAKAVVDAAGCYVLPGIIDAHVHFREPGMTYKEDFATGTTAAACGGVTTIIDMPNVVPITSTVANFKDRVALLTPKALVDFGLLAVIVQDNLEEIVPLGKTGVIGFKIFMGETIGNIPAPDDGAILEAFSNVAKTGLRCGVHAENNQIMQYLIKKLKAQGRTDPLAHAESRPNVCEAEAIQRAILFAREAGSRLHIYHMSTKEGVELVGEAKARGQDVTAETGPHYLLMGNEDMPRLKSVLKMNPPVRTKDNAEKLWQGLLDGRVDMIATDHSPHTPEEKFKDSIFDAIAGFVGVEICVPIMLTEVNKGTLSINKYVQLASENPARVWDMYPQKGTIQVGADGDLTIVDMSREGMVDSDKLHSKNRITPFNGWKTKGAPVCTIVRGQVVMKEGQITGEPKGRLVCPGVKEA